MTAKPSQAKPPALVAQTETSSFASNQTSESEAESRQNLIHELADLLSSDDRLVSEGRLMKNKVIELALNLDPILLRYLLKHGAIKRHFFSTVDGMLVFDKIKFQRFVSNKQFLPDSYTAYKNKIGLTCGEEYLTDSKEVVLSWPYKDCVLEGGQDKEDAKRDEMFWNETLAPDQIDRLLSPKALVKFTKYDRKGKRQVTDLSKDDNLIIKGNNLLALWTLLKRYASGVNCIYVDLPFNTESDSFNYNDNFNHSTWLTFMRNRFGIAKRLLTDDGTLFVHVDDNELGYLIVLLDEVFGRANRISVVTFKQGSATGHKAINPGVVSTTNFIITYAKNKAAWTPNRLFTARAERDKRYGQFIENYDKPFSRWKFTTLASAFSKSLDMPERGLKKTLGDEYEEKISTFVLENAKSVIQLARPDYSAVSGAAREMIDASKAAPTKILKLKRDGYSDMYFIGGQRILFYSDKLKFVDGQYVAGEPLTSLWDDILSNNLHNEGGIGFPKGKKPEALIKRCFDLATNPGDLVLDFCLGSGTTAAVAHKMGRRYIGIEQMDYIETISVERLKKVIAGDQGGISKALEWKGGGSFIYCELAKANQTFVDAIQAAKAPDKLGRIWADMQTNAFLSYCIDPKAIDPSKADYDGLSLKDQKRFLIETLDKNMLYVPLSDIDDKTYAISAADKALNKQFFS